ncbi:hypothetical protein [Streptosporangium nondiastaticum]|uniref:hypothetical protein n=1 Tax=Streptosporangium nondiastaticum TaxID=35764 RepID=UPI0011B27C07|nr:hypothetical protein [Streptosporangium nondiastaticum]
MYDEGQEHDLAGVVPFGPLDERDEEAPCPFADGGVSGVQWFGEAVVQGAPPGFGEVKQGLGCLPCRPLEALSHRRTDRHLSCDSTDLVNPTTQATWRIDRTF